MPKKANPVRAQIIGYKVKKLMKQTGTTQSQLAQAIGRDQTAISRIVNGVRCPSLELLIEIADYFDVSTDFLLGRERK